MFKFATNKFTNSGNNNNSNNNNAGTNSPAHTNTQSTGTSVANRASGIISNVSHNANKLLHSHYHHSSSNQDDSLSKRRQIQKDLFGFNKIADKGFPSKPSAMDYDRKLKLLAIGTKNGDIRIYGQPNTRQQQLSSYQDVHPFPILKLIFVQGQHQLITLSERVQRNDLTNKGESQFYLVLWQIPNINDSNNIIEKVKEYQLDPKILSNTRLSAITLLNDNSHLFMGFETGDVYVFNVSSFQLVPGVINKDYILKNIPEPAANSNTKTQNLKKLNQLGAVESICHHPRQLTKLLIAYQRGLWIIFDFIKNQIDQINQTQQQLESAIFYQYGECVATSHSDGSFILWDLLQSETAASTITTSPNTPSTCTSSSAPNIVYGPYPCKPVTKCLVKTYKNDQPLVIFSGGCPRVNYSDKITISVIQGENNHVCFDFTSKIIDFFTIDKPVIEKHQGQTSLQYDNPQALLVLLEEEFVAIDLITENWPQFKLPYLYSVHSSAIICTHYVNGISKQFYDKLKQYGCVNQESNELYSERDWPIINSNAVIQNEDETIVSKDLLLTGHEDGSIRFWDVTGMSMTLIYRLKTNDYFQTDSTPLDEGVANEDNQNEDNWPPFRKVGTFDPYSDDPKLGIQKIYLCPQREILVVAGTAGQVLIMSLNDQHKEVQSTSIQQHKINIIGVSPEVESHFVWKGHEPLSVRQSGLIKLNPGYQLYSLIQLYPPATVSALALNTDWQLVAMGTSHGFALYDYNQMKDLLIRCTLDPAALLLSNSQNESNNNGTISRRKSLKKSLRESFRKLRRGRSQKQTKQQQPEQSIANRPINNTNQMRVDHLDDDLNGGDMHKPIERQVESREFKPMDDIPPSVIRYMYFVKTYITNNQQQTNSLWVGTNTGIIYIYALQFLLNSSVMQQQQQPVQSNRLTTTLRSTQSINCLLAKEMRLKHRAPVVHIQVIDQNMNPLPLDCKINQSTTSPQPEQHKVIICSEEQFKVFQLPTLKPVCKFKLTAIEGARVRRIGYNCYTSRMDPKYSEHCLSCLSNLGDLSVYSLPQLKRQVQIQCMKQQDINAITSFVFSKQGQAFYLQSPSEFVHISMSARDTPQQSQQQQQSKSSSLTQQPSKKSSNKPSTVNKSSSSNSNNNNTANASPTQQQQAQTSSNNQPVPAPRNNVTTQQSDSTNKRNVDSKSKNPDNNNLTNNVPSPVKSSDKVDIVAPTTTQPTTTVIIENNTETSNNNNNNNEKQDTKPTDESTVSSSTSIIENTNELNTTSNNNNKKNETNANNVSSSNCSSMIETTPVKLSSTNGSNNLINNCSLITAGGQSDSFNVSSSGYNGSCASTSYIANGNASAIDMSMDSVVDRFNDDFHDVSAKKIPTAIDECDDSTSSSANNTTSNNLNPDSSLNVSEMSSDLSTKLNLNGSNNTKTPILNGSNHKNGQINYSFESSCTTSTTNGIETVINGKHTNGKMNGNSEQEVNGATIQPQKASSPLIKQQNGTTNGTNANNRSNKIEQVTKRIENGSKLEYRETAID